MANMISKNIRAPYMETDQWGRRWIDANSKAFWGDKRVSKKETKKSLRDLRERGLILSKRGPNNKKLYCIDEYALKMLFEEESGEKIDLKSELPALEEIIEQEIRMDLIKDVAKEIDNNYSYRLSVII